LFIEEGEVEEAYVGEEKVEGEEEAEEVEERGEVMLDQLKLLIDVTKLWRKVLRGEESISAFSSIIAPVKTPIEVSKKPEKKVKKREGKKATAKKSTSKVKEKKTKTGKSSKKKSESKK
jgi:hypothetical protein